MSTSIRRRHRQSLSSDRAAGEELPKSTPNGELLAEGFFWDGTIGNLPRRLRDSLQEIGYDYRPLALRCYRTGDDFWVKLAAVLRKHGVTGILRESGVLWRGAEVPGE